MPNHGGSRPGAGRPKGTPTLIKKDFAVDLLSTLKHEEEWKSLFAPRTVLDSDGNLIKVDAEPKIKLDALKYLTDRAFGKAPQAVLIGGDGGKPLEIKFLGKPPAWAADAQKASGMLTAAMAAAAQGMNENESD